MHEVATLGPILEHHRCGVVGDAGGEDGEDAGVGIGERLAGAVDVPQPKGHPLHAILLGEGEGQPFLDVLVDGVDAAERRNLGLGRGRRDERPPPPVQRVPGAIGIAPGADHLLVDFAVGVPIKALAIDAHGRGDDDAANGPFDQLLEQHGGAQFIDRGVTLNGIHALADADLGRQVDHRIDPLEGVPHGVRVAYVADPQVNGRVELGRPDTAGMDLLDQVV